MKTIYILRYIQDEKFRRAVQMQLNHGEARHALARWLFFANRVEFRDGDLNEIMNKTSCLSLLCNAAVVWNTVRMQKTSISSAVRSKLSGMRTWPRYCAYRKSHP